ncbi:MAG TPA: ATP-binding protein [Pantanalinema sp.]
MRPRNLPLWLTWVLLALAYNGVAQLTFALGLVQDNVSAIWPAAGFALAAVLRLGYRAWPGIALGVLLKGTVRDIPSIPTLGLGVSDCLIPLLGTALVYRFIGRDRLLATTRNVLLFAFLGCGASVAAGVAIGGLIRIVGGELAWSNAASVMGGWFVSDAVSALVVASLILSWTAPDRAPWLPRRGVELVGLLALLAGAAQVIFGGVLTPWIGQSPVVYLVIPVLMVAAFRFGQRGVTLSNLVLWLLAIAGTLRGLGPFAAQQDRGALLFLEIFVAVTAVSTMVIAAVLAERERAGEELAAAYERLKELDLLKSNLLNAVSHELRTPLTSIQGFAEFLEDRLAGDLSAEQAHFVQQIQQGSRRLAHLVDDLLDVARVESGTFKLALEEADLAHVIRESVMSFQPQAKEAGVTLTEVGLGDPLPIRIDPKRVGQILLNLIGNAIKFTPPGGRIRLGLTLGEHEVRVQVQDTGIGIPPEDLPHVFDKFFQIDNSLTRRRGGTGLGLPITKALVEAHGGTIGVVSESEQGSTFWFALPREAGATGPKEAGARASLDAS